MNKLAIIGSGELGRQIKHLAAVQGKYSFAGFFDDFAEPDKTPGLLGKIDDIPALFRKGKFDFLFSGIGYKHMIKRKEIFQSLAKNHEFGTILHPSAVIDFTSKIGMGCAIYPGVVIDKDAVIGENVLLNNAAVISHTSIIGSHSFISPATAIAGFSEIGESVFLGIGTILIDNIKISSCVSTGAGTVVIKNISEPGLYAGNPARFIK
ncbi:MAG: acetyltransferase [Ignavibacteria bacterium]|nr:acetyltransferase [Ignavibacteria bacterium]